MIGATAVQGNAVDVPLAAKVFNDFKDLVRLNTKTIDFLLQKKGFDCLDDFRTIAKTEEAADIYFKALVTKVPDLELADREANRLMHAW
jgi:hypothetical protein